MLCLGDRLRYASRVQVELLPLPSHRRCPLKGNEPEKANNNNKRGGLFKLLSNERSQASHVDRWSNSKIRAPPRIELN